MKTFLFKIKDKLKNLVLNLGIFFSLGNEVLDKGKQSDRFTSCFFIFFHLFFLLVEMYKKHL